MGLQDRLILSHLKRTHGTLNEGVDQTMTPQFKAWFGNSKVVDEHGKPLIVYHGTAKYFTQFKTEIFWASSTPELASAYSGSRSWMDDSYPQIIPLYMKIENPLIIKKNANEKITLEKLRKITGFKDIVVGKYGDEYVDGIAQIDTVHRWMNTSNFIESIKKYGYDGVQMMEGKQWTYGVIDKFQIKSATGNNGNFDPNNPNINESISHEEIVYDKLYKIDDNTRIEFEPAMEDVWSFSLINVDGKKAIGKVYRVSENEFIARASNIPDIEVQGKTLIDSALELCAMLGEI